MENQERYICENCGKEHDGSYGSGRFCSEHCKRSFNAKKVKNHVCNWPSKKSKGGWECKCGETFLTRRLLQAHRYNCKANKIQRDKGVIWNKGLTAYNDERIKVAKEKLKNRYKNNEIVSPMKGKHLSGDTKKKISEKLKLYYRENPDKVPYIKNHHSKGDSYPEKYFITIFENENIKFNKDFYVDGYFLDFAFKNNCYIEIDGDQHYNDKRIIEHDKIRTEKLKESGWKLIARVKWSMFKSLSETEQEKFILDLINLIKENTSG